MVTIRCSQFQMITYKRDRILVASFWGNYGKEHHLFLWLLEKMESTQHFWCLDGERGEKLVWRGSLCAVGCTSLGPVGCLGMACLLLRNAQPGLASVLPAATPWTRLSLCVPLDQLWNGPRPRLSLSHKDILCPLPRLRVWWVNFLFASLCFFVFRFVFLSLCIAASGLHEGCWVCMHFNK